MFEDRGHGGFEGEADVEFVEAEEAGAGGRGGGGGEDAVVVVEGEHEAAGEGVAVDEGYGGGWVAGCGFSYISFSAFSRRRGKK